MSPQIVTRYWCFSFSWNE